MRKSWRTTGVRLHTQMTKLFPDASRRNQLNTLLSLSSHEIHSNPASVKSTSYNGGVPD